MTTIRRVGFIGIGNMGNPMAGHLVRAGFDVTVQDIRQEAVQAFVAQHGGKAAVSPVEVALGAEAVITMLPDDKVVRKVVLGDGSENCVAAGLAAGSVVIDMSTCNPTGTRSLAEALQPRGIAVVDAPVMGGVVFAKDATLDIMVGGEAALVEQCRPLFEAMGRSIIRCGREAGLRPRPDANRPLLGRGERRAARWLEAVSKMPSRSITPVVIPVETGIHWMVQTR